MRIREINEKMIEPVQLKELPTLKEIVNQGNDDGCDVGQSDLQWLFIQMRAHGLSFDVIAKRLKVSKGTLIKWSRDFGDDVMNYAAIEREALIEAAKLTKRHQIELFGKRLRAIGAELEKRDLSDVSTSKLVEMEMKMLEAANRLGVDTVMQVNEDSVFTKFTKEVKWIA